MADSDVLFEVDASQILAKLHLAGIQSISIGANEILVNTGILNDDIKANPDKPGKVAFDLTNKTGEYEVGYVMPIAYRKSYGVENLIDAISDLLAKTSGNLSKIDDKIDKNSDEYKKIDAAKDKVVEIFKAYKKDVDIDINDLDGIKDLKDEAKNLVKSDEDGYKAAIDKAQDEAIQKISMYLKTFAGSDNVKKIDAASVGQLFISDSIKKSTDKGLVSMYEIQPMSDQEKAKLESSFRAAFEKDPTKENCRCKICFKVKYTLNVDK